MRGSITTGKSPTLVFLATALGSLVVFLLCADGGAADNRPAFRERPASSLEMTNAPDEEKRYAREFLRARGVRLTVRELIRRVGDGRADMQTGGIRFFV